MAAGMTHAHERRRAPRIAQQVSLSIVNPREVIQAETKDLSSSGVYCTLSRFVALMTKLELNFTLPGAEANPIRCTGVIVRVEPPQAESGRSTYQAAIFFSDLSERDRGAIAAFVQHRLHGATGSAHS